MRYWRNRNPFGKAGQAPGMPARHDVGLTVPESILFKIPFSMNISPALLLHLFLILAATFGATAIPPQAMASELDTLLLTASLDGNDAEVARLLAAGASANTRRDDEWTALMLATVNGHTSIVRRLLDGGAAIDLGSLEEGTPLCVAAASPIDPPEGPAAVVQLLLDRGADRNRGNGDGMTPLMFAVREGKKEVAQALLAAGADPDRMDVRGWTPLRFAARSGDTAVLRLLLDAGANPNVRESDSPLTPLDHAVAASSTAAVQMLLRAGADPNGIPVADGWSLTPLMRAAQNRNADIARLLIAARANPNFVVSNEEGDQVVTALDIAMAAGDRPMITLLKNAGGIANPAVVYRNLMSAISSGNSAGVKKSMDYGLDPRIDLSLADSTFMFLKEAARRGNPKVVAALLDFKYPFAPATLYEAYDLARANERTEISELLVARLPSILAPMAAENDDVELLEKTLDRSDTIVSMILEGGRNMLHVAAYHNARGAVDLLLERGATIVRDSWSQRTPIYYAVLGGDTAIVTMLLAAGDSSNRLDMSLWTPLHLAAHAKRAEMIPLLVATGAPIDAVDERGWRALHYAARSGDLATAEALLTLGADPNARTDRNETALDIVFSASTKDEQLIELLRK